MSKTNNRRLRAQVRELEASLKKEAEWNDVLQHCCRCAYCDEVLLRERDELLAHSKVCPGHPCRALEQRIAELEEPTP